MPNEFKVKNGLLVSGSANINASGSEVFSVDGTSGRLFQIDDSLSGSLFSVNTAAGLPVIEAFSDNIVRIGQFGQRALFVSQSRVGVGKESALNAILDISGSISITGSLNVNGTARVSGSTKIGNTVFSDPSSNLIVGIEGSAARSAISNTSQFQEIMLVNTSVSSGNINNWSFGQRRDTFFGNTLGSFQIVGAYIDNSGATSAVGGGYRVPLICNPNGDIIIAGASANAINGSVGIGTTLPAYKLDVSGSGNFTNGLIVTGSLTVITGSNIEFQVLNTGVRIGNLITDIHTVTGSLNVSGSITGSLFGTASFATTASRAISASFTTTASFSTTASFAITASHVLGGATTITIQDEGSTQGSAGTINFTGAGVTATVGGGTATVNIPGGGSGGDITIGDESITQGTATYLNFIGAGVTATVSSNTASITIPGGGGGGTNAKAGSGSAASFGGTPRTASITFGSAFSDNLYSVTVTGEDARTFTIQSKLSTGFTINSNSSVALAGPVYWIATAFN